MPLPRLARPAYPPLAALLTVALLTVVILLTTGACSPARPKPAPPRQATATAGVRSPPGLHWEPCGGGLECARFPVPVDHTRPDGAKIELALIRAPARQPYRRIGSLVLHPGGPGASGVEFVRAGAATGAIGLPLRNRFDIVGFDPRGVGGSAPVRCISDAEKDRLTSTGRVLPATAAEHDELVTDARRFAQGCERSSGALLPFMSTEASARDLDLLRIALGDEKLSYLGFSYGSVLGATYASLFPTRVRAMALDAAVDPDLWFNRPQELVRQQAASFEAALTAFFSYCKARPECGFGKDDPSAAYDRLVDRLDREPIPAVSSADPRPVNGSVVFDAMITALYSQLTWPALEHALKAADEENDGSELLAIADLGSGREPNATYSNLMDSNAATVCTDEINPVDIAVYDRLAEELGRRNPRFGRMVGFDHLPCAFWPVKAASRYTGPFRADGTPPIVVIGTTGDPAAPYAGAKALAGELATGVLVTWRGVSHGAYGHLSECIDDAVDLYFVDLKSPAEGTTCT
ncbi:alpha/beta hydrolase [Frankia sp. Cppng1_Ct_nod]|uniref:alpha/beta hydrolase n=1 Tax=Frankia sp. Cppng1_Ct_nod TaxID=2897162 RepID=UPI00104153A5|nr:alpha/beta hydrolase [Frankia sp. Cppng1_Ct_nod]